MKIDPRRLLEVLAVARCGSFSSAAEALHVSQPALSQSIALLERDLGMRVLDRGRHGAKVNSSGEALLFHAEALEELLARAREEMELRAQGMQGSLTIGITPITSSGLLPEALQILLKEAPNVSVSVVEGLDTEIIRLLRTRKLDMVLSRLGVQPRHTDITEERIFSVDWSIVMGPQHPLRDRPSLRLDGLEDVLWVLPASGSAFREQLELVFNNARTGWPSRAIITNSILAIKAIVMNTDCITVISPRLVEVEVAAGRLCAVPLEDVGSLREVGLALRRSDKLSPIAARFRDILREIASRGTDATHSA
ncbi:LysR family transcriptional regulator [Breoghania corrubedonensis]|uniref:LysR family transcriptional regulator n=1 Tax=Breoghania corrubedonensis TaxID=665038 RepID=A0A2T5VHF0_9HYPH|nr:LysR family transcriptional regulator [Breoghania corrubedonensis]PTW63185.1 LysR family transcriptional regulator [Breoghania corrubedonensis]